MSVLNLTVISNQAINKGTTLSSPTGAAEVLKESMSHLVLSDGKSELKTILPYNEGRLMEIGYVIKVTLDRVKK